MKKECEWKRGFFLSAAMFASPAPAAAMALGFPNVSQPLGHWVTAKNKTKQQNGRKSIRGMAAHPSNQGGVSHEELEENTKRNVLRKNEVRPANLYPEINGNCRVSAGTTCWQLIHAIHGCLYPCFQLAAGQKAEATGA